MNVTVKVEVHVPTAEQFRVEAITSYGGQRATVAVEWVYWTQGADTAHVSGWKVSKSGGLGSYTKHAAVHVMSLPREVRAQVGAALGQHMAPTET